MGKFGNGELTAAEAADMAQPKHFPVNCDASGPHKIGVLRACALGHRWPVTSGDIKMLETYFSAPKMLERLRSGPSGPYLDGFAAVLRRDGYSPSIAVRYLRAAAHLGHFVRDQGGTLAGIDLLAFGEHLRTCRCPRSKGGRRNHHTLFGAKCYRDFLLEIGVWQPDATTLERAEPELLTRFKQWLRKHRGLADPTIRLYARDAASLMLALGDDPTRWDAAGVRTYFMERAGQSGKGTVEKLVTGLRAFLRYLAVDGKCQADLDTVVPAYACWRLAELPRYLTAEQVNSLIAACDGDSPGRRRDRAILLLLVRLGLRAGDVAQLRLADIEWGTGTLRICGKSRYQVRLPLPQEAGDAIAAYLECRPSASETDRVFLRNIAPYRPFLNGDGVSSMVKHLMQRAGVVSPVKGAHALRHTAATEMLRHGVPLEKIGLVLRHRGIDTTAYYAKADVTGLKHIALPWPQVLPC
jgi:site-specific recombinase XerD